MWPFSKKSFTMPLTDKRPMVVMIGGKTRYFESTNTEQDLSQTLIKAYNELSEVSSPINKIAEFGSVVIPEPVDQNGKAITDPNILKWFNHPNANQNWQEFYKKHLIYRLLLGNSYINSFGYRSQSFPGELKLLPPQYTKIVLKDKKDFRNLEIERYVIKINGWGDVEITDIASVLHIKNTSPYFGKEGDLYGQSKLIGCLANIESIKAGYDAKIGLYKHGPSMVITGKTIGEFASANAMTGEDIRAVENRFNNAYGMGSDQLRVMATNIPLDVTKVSMNVAELRINENNLSDFQAICRALDIDSKAIGDPTNTTYNNVVMAFDSFLNGSFKILIENDYSQWSSWLSERFKRPIIINPNFENIPDIVNKEKEGNEDIITMAKEGLLTRNEALQRIGEEPVNLPEFNQYYTFVNGNWQNINQNVENGTDETDENI